MQSYTQRNKAGTSSGKINTKFPTHSLVEFIK